MQPPASNYCFLHPTQTTTPQTRRLHCRNRTITYLWTQPSSTFSNMSQRFHQVQSEAAYRSASPRPKSQTSHVYRSSSDTSNSSSSSSSSYGSSQEQSRYSTESPQPRVEVLRCSRCAKCVETVNTGRGSDSRRASTDDASANGMVRFGHNLYYCDRCARMVGYK